MDIKSKYEKEIKGKLMKNHGYSSPLAAARLVKIVINTGVGRIRDEKEKETIEKYVSMIAGQKAHGRPAKKSIASFKSREGMIIGYSATLRGQRMYDFVDKLITLHFRRLSGKMLRLFLALRRHLSYRLKTGKRLWNFIGSWEYL